uniref:SH3 domain-containing protein n=1 Tax=Periophthalmus magnuspinnatus TaxID=409849 RepID=A0A3B4B6Z3_9GOBI
MYFTGPFQLQTLKKTLNLDKGTDQDETILQNTYDPQHCSPRFTKNERREKESSEKVNINNSLNEEETQGSKVKKKSKKEKRSLPPLPSADDNIKDVSKFEIISEAVKEPKRKSKKGRAKEDNQDIEGTTEEPQRPAFDDSLVLGVYIHRTDRLKTDLLISHPMVKVHVVDEITGQYVKKEDCHRPVSSFYENESVDHILPIMTQPFDFKINKSVIPEWQEQIIFNERFCRFVQNQEESPRVLLFFELVGANGVLNIDSKLRLQLFCPPIQAKRQPKTIEVIEWWRKYPRHKYPSTLYVTVKGIKIPEHVEPSLRSMMPLQEERGSTTYSELQNEVTRKSISQVLDDKPPIFKWSRLPGQVCRIPNKSMLAFRGGQMGCFTVLFSNAGTMMAAACADRDTFPVVEWDIERLSANAQKMLPHPSFVYSAQYHPSAQSLVVTGGYDSLVRVWRLDVQDVNGQLLQEFEGHSSFINTICFDSEGGRMFSADNAGTLIVWQSSVKDSSCRQPCQHWCVERKIEEADLRGVPINKLQLHPNGRCLLIHAKDSVLRMIDLRILAVKKYIGAINYKERIYSTFTPCGNFIFSGSEDGMAYVWNTDTGDQVAVYSELCYPTALHGVSFHPHENMVAFCAFGQSHPIHVYIYDRKVSQLEVYNIKGLSRATSVDPRTVRNTPDSALHPDTPVSSTAALDQFAQSTRLALRMQTVKEKLDSVLMGLNSPLPPPPFLSPHSKLQFSGALIEQLIPQAVVALYDYKANRSDELTIHRGDVIQVLYKDNENWWFGQLSNRQQGYFLASYVVDESKCNLHRRYRIKVSVSAAISSSGELRFLSEPTLSDTEPELISTK